MTGRAVSRQLENHFDIALTAAGLGIWEWDVAAGTVSWSEQIETMHGMAPGSFSGDFDAFAATIHPADRESVLVGVQRTLESGEDLHNHYRFLRSDGSVGWLRGVGRLLYDGAGTPMRLIGVAMDVTEETEADLQLRAAYAERDAVARTLQAGLLAPALPRISGLDLAAAYEPGHGDVGGDFYDVFPLAGGRWALTIGDVCGKGHEAAALTALVRHALRTAALLDDDPSSVLHAANRAHLSADTDERFSTAHYLHLEPVDGRIVVRLGSGGHPPVIVIRADGSHELHTADGPLLGVLDDAVYTTASFTLEQGDMLVAYTDGVTEARNADRSLFGVDGIVAALSDVGDGRATAVVAALMAATTTFADGALSDDIAIVVGRVAD